MNDAKIRDLRIEDVALVVDMLRESFDSRLWPYMVYVQRGISDFLSVFLQFPEASPGRHSLVLTRDAKIEGFADFRVLDESIGFLSYICTRPEARGRGVATSLIAHFLELHPELTQLQLDVFRDNTAAVGLYEKLGFRAQSSGAWVTRALPVADGFVEVASLPTSLAAHRAYGFCELDIIAPVHNARIGLLGEIVLKCPTLDTFVNDKLLAALRNTFHGVDRAFAVLPIAEASELVVKHEVVNLTDRMTLALR